MALNPDKRIRKEDQTRKTIVAVHMNLARFYDHRIFQYIRPELCIKLECTTEKFGTQSLFVQILGYYFQTTPGIVIYSTFNDFLAMIYGDQTIDNLAAAKKCSFVLFL